MSNGYQHSSSQNPAEFRPHLAGRLFTANDAVVDSTYDVHPTARLLYDALPQEYRDVFKNCRMYLSKHTEFVKFLKYMSEIDVKQTDANHERLKPLGIQIPTEEGDKKKWQCGVEGCDFRGTLQHLYTHLQRRSHINLAMFACRECQMPFYRRHDRARHEKTMHPQDSSTPMGTPRSERGVSPPATVAQIPTSKARAGGTLNKPQAQPPAYNDNMYGEDMASDTPSPPEGGDHISMTINSGSPPRSTNQTYHPDGWPNDRPLFLSDSKGSDHEPLQHFSATTGSPIVVTPTPHPARPCRDFDSSQSISGGTTQTTHPWVLQPQSQPFFARPTQQYMVPPFSSSRDFMFVPPNYRHGFQASNTLPVVPVQPTNNGGMHAHNITNNYHIHSPVDASRSTGDNLHVRTLHTEWPEHTMFNPHANLASQAQNQSHTPTPLQPTAYAPLGTASPAGSYYYVHHRHGLANDTTQSLHQHSSVVGYPGSFLGYGTSNNAPCTLIPSGRASSRDTGSPCLHHVAQADSFKSRTLEYDLRGDASPQEWAQRVVSVSSKPSTPTYGEKLAKCLRICISGLRNPISSSISPSLPRHSLDLVDEKANLTPITRPFHAATCSMRGIKPFVICCLVALLLSAGLLYTEWRFGVAIL